jgi:Transposase and inactivated derivatives
MCRVLQVNRSTYYYESKDKPDETKLVEEVKEIFRQSRHNYGTRKIKYMLASHYNKQISRRRIGRIMSQEGLSSHYTVAPYRSRKDCCNDLEVANIVARKFQNQAYREVVVSDLTYVRVGNKWNYVCTLMDLFNREIIGCSAGAHKTPELVKEAFATIQGSLKSIGIFHTDRGSEFRNKEIDEVLKAFQITRSLSEKGCPYDNAVAEVGFKILKTEFIWTEQFATLEELKLKLGDYIHWYNHHRIHGSLGYLTPVQYRKNVLEKVV